MPELAIPITSLIDGPLSWAHLGPVSAAPIGLGTLGFDHFVQDVLITFILAGALG